jgi:calcineurin-like phosphoesterase
MCGALDSSLGVTFDSVIPRWRDGLLTKNIIASSGRVQFSALLVDVDPATQKALNVEHIYKIYPSAD